MIITQTPLRISLAGGGTDFADFYLNFDGMVLSTAIDKYIYVIVKERFDSQIYINYTKKEIVDRVDQIEHELVREAMLRTGVSEGVEITTLADIPSEGSGLGSSSSLTVGLLNALYTYRGNSRPGEQLAQEASEIEIDVLGKPIGKQDQYIAAFGGLRMLTFRSDGSVEVESLEVADSLRLKLSSNLMLFYTDRTRKSEAILTKQKASIDKKISVLQAMKEQVLEARNYILNESLDDVGRLLHRGWEYKKTLAAGISDDEINQMYETTLESGAIGGKISGAGGGGFLLVYCTPSRQESVRLAMSKYREMPFSFERDGSKVIFNVRRDGWPRK